VRVGRVRLSCLELLTYVVVLSLGEASVSWVVWELRRRYGVEVSRSGVRRALAGLVGKGLVRRSEEGYYVPTAVVMGGRGVEAGEG
jgi:Sugar-specific transcriptional regulator TrmB.